MHSFLFDFFEILWYNIYTKMRGENKMIDYEFVDSAINGVIERFRNRADEYIRRTYFDVVTESGEVEEIHFFIEDELDMLLDGLGVYHDVKIAEAYEGDDFALYVVGVAYIVTGKMYTHVFSVEQHY